MIVKSTANTITWGLYVLAQRPDVQEKLRKIVADIDFNSAASFDIINENRYIMFLWNEILRLYSAFPLLSRQSLQQEVFNGVTIPKGTTYFLCSYFFHHSKELWGDDAEKFRPERWEDIIEKDIDETGDGNRNLDDGKFVPFSIGPRGCIGRQFAACEGKIILSALIQKFKFSLIKGQEKVNAKVVVVLKPNPDIWLNVERA